MAHGRCLLDESRPTCKRCEKAGYSCAGYERKLELRFHSFSNEAETTPSGSAKTTKEPRLSSNPRVPTSVVLGSNDNPRGFVPSDMSLVAFKNDIQFAYLFDNFVWSSYGTPWLQMSAEGRVDSLSLEACRAFSLSIFGKHHHQPDIELSGAIHYDKAVRALSSRLSSVGAPGSEELIIPIMILLMHSSTTPDPQAAAFHLQGLLKLIQICGPRKFAEGILRNAFESCRATLITVALITKTRTFLEQSIWLTEPWAEIGAANKSFQNQLVDVLVHLPGFLQDQDQLEQAQSAKLKSDLVRRIEFQIERISQWRWRWEASNVNMVWEAEPEMLPEDYVLAHFRPIRSFLVFSSCSQATELSLYNAVLLCLLALLWTLTPPDDLPPSPVPAPTTPLALPGDVESLTQPAIEICRAFEYQLTHIRNSRDSALFWLFPLGLASRVLEDDTSMMLWIKTMLETSQVTRGYGTGGNAYGFGFYRFPKIRRQRAQQLNTLFQARYSAEAIKHYSDGSSSTSSDR
ncbi:uncharacterized protein A1O9_02089 [Exophiala aquamarina CBS 119918]|uniref:Zn(2)-C6 fungal-type domain-containing protein n=1 Tax=Exophiala aquamarina CBS 119918 TaxID=1182545 RepID=A0A072PMF9_9EURO|nr:uncharacterized protein A1O9_02089 [Exophiala aquamarina CBS 119918]KEF60528.1 hypothetical protein A1O9_02089 [Exophiala aquamarina CBS 119918]